MVVSRMGDIAGDVSVQFATLYFNFSGPLSCGKNRGVSIGSWAGRERVASTLAGQMGMGVGATLLISRVNFVR
jgi:hypothetical protein